MSKNGITLLSALALFCVAAGASPTPYGYSYTFSDGTVVSGTLTGDDTGNGYLSDVANITMLVNGVQLPGAFYAYGYANTWAGWQPSAAKVSFDGVSNSFLFADEVPPLVTPTRHFYYQNSSEWCGANSCALLSIDSPHFDTSDVGAAAANWQLAPLSVPEPGTLGLVCCACVLGWKRWRRPAQ